jgi:ABC-2 type transport system ATP-binding protein
VIEARNVSRFFGRTTALDDVSLVVQRGEIHALLGPNGAGKTTLIRVLTGLVTPSSGSVFVLGVDAEQSPRALRRRLGLVPSGDRTFYLRISGLENLVFFARLHGMPRKTAVARCREVMGEVGLLDAARRRVGLYSHGMQKRLSIARALITEPDLLLLDEPTHDLDPEGASDVRELVRDLARRGAAVVWATQRIEEVRGFAHNVTLIQRGKVRFSGSVPRLMAHAIPRRYLVRLRNGVMDAGRMSTDLQETLGPRGTIASAHEYDAEHFLLSLADGVVLGDALAVLTAANCQVLTCREERPEIEEAFLALTREPL